MVQVLRSPVQKFLFTESGICVYESSVFPVFSVCSVFHEQTEQTESQTRKIIDMQHVVYVIEAGNVVHVDMRKVERFRNVNVEQVHMFGPKAIPTGQSPITLRVNFTNGGTVKFRGDRKTGYVNIMVENLRSLLKRYIGHKKVLSATMYDNRTEVFTDCFGYSSSSGIIILKYENGKVVENMLPIYNDKFNLKREPGK